MKKRLLTIIVLLILISMPKIVLAEEHLTTINELGTLYGIKISKAGTYDASFGFKATSELEMDNGHVHGQTVFSSSFTSDENCFRASMAFCVTPGVTNSPKDGYTCTSLKNSLDPIAYPATYIMNVSDTVMNKKQKAIAMRMLVALFGQSSCPPDTTTVGKKCRRIMNGYKVYFCNKTDNNSLRYTSIDTTCYSKPSGAISDYFTGDYADLEKARLQILNAVHGQPHINFVGQAYKCEATQNTAQAQRFYIRVDGSGCAGSCDPNSDEEVDTNIEGDYNNCCEVNTESELHEVTLDELFADDECLGIEKYKPKINSEKYKDPAAKGDPENGKLDSDFCELYCTERVIIKQPAGFSMATGHYFTPAGTTYKGISAKSPIVDSYRRCRVRIKFNNWAKKYTEQIASQIIPALNEYNKAKRTQEYYKTGINNSTTYPATNKLVISATCTRSTTYTACDNYTLESTATNVPSVCTTGYSSCTAGYTDHPTDSSKCISINDVTQDVEPNYNSSGAAISCPSGCDQTTPIAGSTPGSYKCTKTGKVTKNRTVTGYSCPDTTAPAPIPANTPTTYTDSFEGVIYSFGVKDYTYKKYDLTRNGSCYSSLSYTNANEKGNDVEHKLYSVYMTQDKTQLGYSTIGASVDALNTFITTSEASDALTGKTQCAHSSNTDPKYVSYTVTCTPNWGELNKTDSDGNLSIEYDEDVVSTEKEYSKDGGYIDQKALTYMVKTKLLREFEEKLDKCNNYFSSGYGSDPSSYKIDPKLDFYYTQVYLDNYGKPASGSIPVHFNRVCTSDNPNTAIKVKVINKDVYSDLDEANVNLDIITDNSLDQLISVRYATKTDCAPNSNNKKAYLVPVCLDTSNAGDADKTECDLASTKNVLLNQYTSASIYASQILKNQTVIPAFEYDALYNTICYWEPNDAPIMTKPQEGSTIRSFQFPSWDVNASRPMFYMGSEYQFRGKFLTYINLTDIASATSKDRFNDYMQKYGLTCAKKTSSSSSYSTLSCTYTAYDFESKTGYCDDKDNPGIPLIDEKYCKITASSPYSFKVVDTDNLFPECQNDSSLSETTKCFDNTMHYGYNWLKTTEGYNTLKEIQSADTYDTSNLTYSFKLDSQAMKAIKKYNKDHLSKGGYADNDLSCKSACNVDLMSIVNNPEHIVTKTEYWWYENNTKKTISDNIDVIYYDKACSKCLSSFLTDLANRKVGTETLTKDAWNRPSKTINQVRDDPDLMKW